MAEDEQVVLDTLSKANARINHDLRSLDAALDGPINPLGKECANLRHHVVIQRATILLHIHRIAATVHQDDGHIGTGDKIDHAGIIPHRGNVVDDVRAGVERSLGYAG